jgi:hypothetical protein
MLTTGPAMLQLHCPSGYAQSRPSGEHAFPTGTAAYEAGHMPGRQCAGGGKLHPVDVHEMTSLHCGFGSEPYSHSIPTTGHPDAPLGGLAGHAWSPPPLELVLPPPLPPPELPPLPDPLLAPEPLPPPDPLVLPELVPDPELLVDPLPEPDAEPDPDPDPELDPDPDPDPPPSSAPPSPVPLEKVAPPHAHIVAHPAHVATTQTIERMPASCGLVRATAVPSRTAREMRVPANPRRAIRDSSVIGRLAGSVGCEVC